MRFPANNEAERNFDTSVNGIDNIVTRIVDGVTGIAKNPGDQNFKYLRVKRWSVWGE